MAKQYDLVLWGATGFTGKLATAYLSGTKEPFKSAPVPLPPIGLRWAVAGRSKQKLEDGLRTAGAPAGVGVFVAEADDEAAIKAFVSQTKVVCSMAGPFQKYSSKVVKACAEAGTHYVDINGEIPWHRVMIDSYGDAAKRSGACIVPACGFDSVPSDLSTYLAVQQLRRAGAKGPIRRSRCYQFMNTGGGGGFSGGSMATGILQELDPIPLPPDAPHDCPFLIGGETKAGVREEDKDNKPPQFYEDVKSWAAPFIMSKVNSRVVRRTSELLDYGPEFNYQEVHLAPTPKAAEKMFKSVTQMPPAKVRAQMVKKGRLPSPGQGPSPEVRGKSSFQSLSVAETEAGEKAWAALSGGEAGYEETAKMVVEAALTLALHLPQLPGRAGGFMTPAVCFGEVYANRLVRAGIKIAAGSGAPGKAKL